MGSAIKKAEIDLQLSSSNTINTCYSTQISTQLSLHVCCNIQLAKKLLRCNMRFQKKSNFLLMLISYSWCTTSLCATLSKCRPIAWTADFV